MRADVLANSKGGERFLAGGRINELCFRSQYRQAKGAHQATLLIFIRLRRMMAAVSWLRVLFDRRAAARFHHLRQCCLRRESGDGNRGGNNQVHQKSQHRSH